MKRYLLPLLVALCLGNTARAFTVTNTNDGGPGSLRQAIDDANVDPGADSIDFNIPGSGVQTISPIMPLPTCVYPVTIDGYTQPGSSVNTLAIGSDAVLLIELKGPAGEVSGSHGLVISGGNSTVRGLIINDFNAQFSDGVFLSTFGNNRVEGCWIGTDATGIAASGNINGVVVFDGPGGNTIGGSTPEKRNVISGNFGLGISSNTGGNTIQNNYVGTDKTGSAIIPNFNGGILTTSQVLDPPSDQIGGTAGANTRNVVCGNNNGITVQSPGNVIEGNFIGVDASGSMPLGNNGIGLFIGGADNTVGGPTAASRNVISANITGLLINGGDNGAGDNTTVQGNFIGTNAAGTAALGNSRFGINFANDAENTKIGGPTTTPGQPPGNVISGNGEAGIFLGGGTGTSALGSVIQGNLIGTDISGTVALGNAAGINLGESNVTTGGTAAGAGNVIAFNDGDGIAVSGTGHAIEGNAIFGNGLLGIDLNTDLVTLNDPCDGDTGPNNFQNFPVITKVTNGGGLSSIRGTLNSVANKRYRIEFFANDSIDPSGFGEGQIFIGFTSVKTRANCNASFNVSFPQIGSGQRVTATATDPSGNTSEFSKRK